jgi:ribosomal protein L14E/L6E/L27E
VAVEGVDIVDERVLSVTRTVLDVERRKCNHDRFVGGKCKVDLTGDQEISS